MSSDVDVVVGGLGNIEEWSGDVVEKAAAPHLYRKNKLAASVCLPGASLARKQRVNEGKSNSFVPRVNHYPRDGSHVGPPRW